MNHNLYVSLRASVIILRKKWGEEGDGGGCEVMVLLIEVICLSRGRIEDNTINYASIHINTP